MFQDKRATIEPHFQVLYDRSVKITREIVDPYTACAVDILGEKGHSLTWVFNMDEYRDDSISRGVATMAAKLILWKKYPHLRRVRLIRIFSSAWVELCSFISYERGKFYTQFVPKVIKGLPLYGRKRN